jgi:hypothetical protein
MEMELSALVAEVRIPHLPKIYIQAKPHKRHANIPEHRPKLASTPNSGVQSWDDGT